MHDYLCDKGYKVIMPLLAGHEKTLRDLSLSKYRLWLQSAEDAYLALSKTCDDVIVIGFSMGGLIAVNLYQRHRFGKIITVNTPIYYWNIKRMVLNLCSDFKTYSGKYFFASVNKPLRSLLEFQKLLSRTKPLFSKMDCDALIIQTQDDDTVNIKSADYIYKKIKGSKTLLKPPSGGHVVFLYEQHQSISEAIYDFIVSVKH